MSIFRFTCRWTATALPSALAGAALFGSTPAAAAVDETAFLADLPVVSMVTRLPQAQADVPGALTVLDREAIRRSGARDLVDLLRWVPGFFVSGWSGSHRIASYHASLDEYGTRMQVYIDGRSVYSTFFLGGASTAMTSIALDDIERVEVLRGANSASFGTNAMFGVIHVVTRHASDTPGIAAHVTAGGNGIGDAYARAGWQGAGGNWRLSMSTVGDRGFTNVPDTRRIDRYALRGDFSVAGGELMLALGHQRQRTFNGFANDPVDKLHATREAGDDLAVHWRLPLAGGSEFAVAASLTEESFDDHWDYELGPGFAVGADLGGRASRVDVELQHIVQWSANWRSVWGFGARHESARSVASYAKPEVTADRMRVFANVEWRPADQWTANLGGLVERLDGGNNESAPRAAINWHVAPNHTVRVATTKAFRMPTLFEAHADQRFYEVTTGMYVARHYFQPKVPAAERLTTREVGYLGQWPAARAWLDVRVFDERSSNLIVVVPNQAPPPNNSNVTSANNGKLTNRGIEYQLRWLPLPGTDLHLAQTFMRPVAPTGSQFDNFVPRHVSSIGLVQDLPANVAFTALLAATDTVSSRRIGARTIEATRQLDLRLARRFVIGNVHAESALTWHAVNGEVPVYDPGRHYAVPRQLFLTLALEI